MGVIFIPPLDLLKAYNTALESPAFAQKMVFLSNKRATQVEPLYGNENQNKIKK